MGSFLPLLAPLTPGISQKGGSAQPPSSPLGDSLCVSHNIMFSDPNTKMLGAQLG